jgi:outer membrane immunogenic protein
MIEPEMGQMGTSVESRPRIETRFVGTRSAGVKMTKSLLWGAVALVTLGVAAPAMAADLPPAYSKAPMMVPAVYDWSGFYVGLNGGWGDADRCWDQTAPRIAPEGCHNTTGGFAGAQAGYRWQTASSWVWGFESQGDWADLRGSNISLVTGNSNRSHIDTFALFTGQVGYAWNTALLYFKAGGALIADRNDIAAGGTAFATASGDNRWGGTVGAGVEFSFAPNWSAALEYNHLFIANNNTNFTNIVGGTLVSTDRLHGDADLVSVHVNYRWGGPVVAKY